MTKTFSLSPLFYTAKAIFLLFNAVYMMFPAAYYWIVAVPTHTVDSLLPYEVLFCSIASLMLFYWSGKTIWKTIKN